MRDQRNMCKASIETFTMLQQIIYFSVIDFKALKIGHNLHVNMDGFCRDSHIYSCMHRFLCKNLLLYNIKLLYVCTYIVIQDKMTSYTHVYPQKLLSQALPMYQIAKNYYSV